MKIELKSKATPAMRRVFERINAGETPYAAAKAEGVALSSIYRRQEYKGWRKGAK